MTSVKTQIPYEYYSLAFCKPEGGVHYRTENLGKGLHGQLETLRWAGRCYAVWPAC